jgi:hypothetical protein
MNTNAINPATAADQDTSGPAKIAPATAFTPAGATDQVTEIDPLHPAVDNDPRAGTTVDQNRIDFNDPTISGSDAVAKNLGMKTEAEAIAETSKGAKPKS